MKIEIENLSKSYGRKAALRGIDLQINEGMFGLLGPNGAGKTTLMRILATLLKKSEGSVVIDGIDIGKRRDIRSIIGYLPQEFSMYPSMTVYEAMDYLAILSGVSPAGTRKNIITELLKRVNLASNYKTKVRALSGGMKRRLGIAQALLNNPKVLIVDEPTAGLDPEERVRFRNLLSEFSQGRIVILSTHIVEDIECTCENLAVLNEGSILFNGKVSELIAGAEDRVWTIEIKRNEFEAVRGRFQVISSVSEGEMLKVRVLSPEKPSPDALSVEPSIEDAYLRLMEGVQ